MLTPNRSFSQDSFDCAGAARSLPNLEVEHAHLACGALHCDKCSGVGRARD